MPERQYHQIVGECRGRAHGVRSVYRSAVGEDLEWRLAGRGMSTGEPRVQSTVSKLGSECWHCSGSDSCLHVQAEGQGRK